jgi:hypothetical protein
MLILRSRYENLGQRLVYGWAHMTCFLNSAVARVLNSFVKTRWGACVTFSKQG